MQNRPGAQILDCGIEPVYFNTMRYDTLRRITTWLAILGYGLVASGLPLPLESMWAVATDSPAAKRLAGKDRSQPFPCIDKACGCATAAQCFASCCCHTPAERLAWAKLHRVESAVLEALEHRVAGEVRTACLTTARVSPTPNKPACSSSLRQESDSCCSEPASPLPPSAPAAPAAEEWASPPAQTVILRAMLACGGIASEWFSMAVSLPPPRVAVFQAFISMARLDLRDEIVEQVFASPGKRPPRAA